MQSRFPAPALPPPCPSVRERVQAALLTSALTSKQHTGTAGSTTTALAVLVDAFWAAFANPTAARGRGDSGTDASNTAPGPNLLFPPVPADVAAALSAALRSGVSRHDVIDALLAPPTHLLPVSPAHTHPHSAAEVVLAVCAWVGASVVDVCARLPASHVTRADATLGRHGYSVGSPLAASGAAPHNTHPSLSLTSLQEELVGAVLHGGTVHSPAAPSGGAVHPPAAAGTGAPPAAPTSGGAAALVTSDGSRSLRAHHATHVFASLLAWWLRDCRVASTPPPPAPAAHTLSHHHSLSTTPWVTSLPSGTSDPTTTSVSLPCVRALEPHLPFLPVSVSSARGPVALPVSLRANLVRLCTDALSGVGAAVTAATLPQLETCVRALVLVLQTVAGDVTGAHDNELVVDAARSQHPRSPLLSPPAAYNSIGASRIRGGGGGGLMCLQAQGTPLSAALSDLLAACVCPVTDVATSRAQVGQLASVANPHPTPHFTDPRMGTNLGRSTAQAPTPLPTPSDQVTDAGNRHCKPSAVRARVAALAHQFNSFASAVVDQPLVPELLSRALGRALCCTVPHTRLCAHTALALMQATHASHAARWSGDARNRGSVYTDALWGGPLLLALSRAVLDSLHEGGHASTVTSCALLRRVQLLCGFAAVSCGTGHGGPLQHPSVSSVHQAGVRGVGRANGSVFGQVLAHSGAGPLPTPPTLPPSSAPTTAASSPHATAAAAAPSDSTHPDLAMVPAYSVWVKRVFGGDGWAGCVCAGVPQLSAFIAAVTAAAPTDCPDVLQSHTEALRCKRAQHSELVYDVIQLLRLRAGELMSGMGAGVPLGAIGRGSSGAGAGVGAGTDDPSVDLDALCLVWSAVRVCALTHSSVTTSPRKPVGARKTGSASAGAAAPEPAVSTAVRSSGLSVAAAAASYGVVPTSGAPGRAAGAAAVVAVPVPPALRHLHMFNASRFRGVVLPLCLTPRRLSAPLCAPTQTLLDPPSIPQLEQATSHQTLAASGGTGALTTTTPVKQPSAPSKKLLRVVQRPSGAHAGASGGVCVRESIAGFEARRVLVTSLLHARMIPPALVGDAHVLLSSVGASAINLSADPASQAVGDCFGGLVGAGGGIGHGGGGGVVDVDADSASGTHSTSTCGSSDDDDDIADTPGAALPRPYSSQSASPRHSGVKRTASQGKPGGRAHSRPARKRVSAGAGGAAVAASPTSELETVLSHVPDIVCAASASGDPAHVRRAMGSVLSQLSAALVSISGAVDNAHTNSACTAVYGEPVAASAIGAIDSAAASGPPVTTALAATAGRVPQGMSQDSNTVDWSRVAAAVVFAFARTCLAVGTASSTARSAASAFLDGAVASNPTLTAMALWAVPLMRWVCGHPTLTCLVQLRACDELSFIGLALPESGDARATPSASNVDSVGSLYSRLDDPKASPLSPQPLPSPYTLGIMSLVVLGCLLDLASSARHASLLEPTIPIHHLVVVRALCVHCASLPSIALRAGVCAVVQFWLRRFHVSGVLSRWCECVGGWSGRSLAASPVSEQAHNLTDWLVFTMVGCAGATAPTPPYAVVPDLRERCESLPLLARLSCIVDACLACFTVFGLAALPTCAADLFRWALTIPVLSVPPLSVQAGVRGTDVSMAVQVPVAGLRAGVGVGTLETGESAQLLPGSGLAWAFACLEYRLNALATTSPLNASFAPPIAAPLTPSQLASLPPGALVSVLQALSSGGVLHAALFPPHAFATLVDSHSPPPALSSRLDPTTTSAGFSDDVPVPGAFPPPSSPWDGIVRAVIVPVVSRVCDTMGASLCTTLVRYDLAPAIATLHQAIQCSVASEASPAPLSPDQVMRLVSMHCPALLCAPSYATPTDDHTTSVAHPTQSTPEQQLAHLTTRLLSQCVNDEGALGLTFAADDATVHLWSQLCARVCMGDVTDATSCDCSVGCQAAAAVLVACLQNAISSLVAAVVVLAPAAQWDDGCGGAFFSKDRASGTVPRAADGVARVSASTLCSTPCEPLYAQVCAAVRVLFEALAPVAVRVPTAVCARLHASLFQLAHPRALAAAHSNKHSRCSDAHALMCTQLVRECVWASLSDQRARFTTFPGRGGLVVPSTELCTAAPSEGAAQANARTTTRTRALVISYLSPVEVVAWQAWEALSLL